ncbi:MAG TPA: DUF2510 domain-containing protein [Intrasporangiaceae bacterium]|nr:DUF2510 domain-containing protein [Intrasporangiaceae bacterium]
MRLFGRRSKGSDSPPPAAWYAAPDRLGFFRYWDGSQWTDQYRPVQRASTPEQPEGTSRSGLPESLWSAVRPGSLASEVRDAARRGLDRVMRTERAPELKPVKPWARASVWQNVVGESHYREAFLRIVQETRARRGEYGTDIDGVSALVIAEPRNEYDPNAVAVFVLGHKVGYLPRDAAALYSAPLQDLADRGEALAVEARVWVAPVDDTEMGGSVSLMLPPAQGVQSFNDLPGVPCQVIPQGGAIQVTGEDQHMDVLGKYVGDGERHLAVTLHVVEEQKTERSKPYDCVEVRLDGHRVGVLTRAMSEKMVDVVQYISDRGKLPVCRAVLKGSSLRAEVVLFVAKSHEVSQRWLDAVDSGEDCAE